MKPRILMLLLLLVITMASFGTKTVVLADDGGAEWSYEGATGPAYWGELDPDYALCATGTEQSPVAIPSSAPLNPANLRYQYQPSRVNIFNTGYTIQVNYDAGSTLTLEGDTYELVQFHFHAHSEHTKDGQTTPMELHLVHRNAAGQLAVVGVWLTQGSANAAYAPVLNHLPTTEDEPQPVPGETVNADALLPAERSYYGYNGSLTTPPCTEGVKWVMLGQMVELSAAQINAYTSIFDANFRPVQRAFPLTPNQAPSGSVGGPYTVPEGGSVSLSASGEDPEGDTPAYTWDLDNDDTFETPSQDVTFSAVGRDGPSQSPIKVQICDEQDACSTAEGTVTITNVAPVVTSMTSTSSKVKGKTVATVSATFTDAGTGDTHTATWNWGDGSPSEPGTVSEADGSGTVMGSHTYPDGGSYTITLTVTDDDGAAGQKQSSAGSKPPGKK